MTWSGFRSDDVSLRPFSPDDAPVLEAYLNQPDLEGRRYIPWSFPEYAPLSTQQVEAILQKWGQAEDELHLAVIHRETGDLIGHADCEWEWDPHNPSVSVVIDPGHQRQGLGSQVLRLLLNYLLEQTPAHNITAWIASWNTAALAFAARHGFQQAGRMRRAGIRHGAYFDTMILDMLRSEWQPEGGGTDAS
ncbi:MAG: GNAT family N-acetyltransferase [Anaerolineae bacterium]|nr:GNAT family N-acetyltransferase [Anaerolineae bacterium]